MVIEQAYRFALAPTRAQTEFLEGCAGASRFWFNQGLALVKERLDERDAGHEVDVPWSYKSLCVAFRGRAIKDELAPWRSEVVTGSYQAGLEALGKALQRFSEGRRTGHRDFADFLAVSQAIPGPNMILMMSFIGWKVAGLPGAIASACATFAPPCAMYSAAYRLWNRFRDAPWQRLARAGLAPLTAGFVVAGGTVMARTADISWPAVGVTGGAAALLLFTRLNPLWMLGGAGLVGALGVL